MMEITYLIDKVESEKRNVLAIKLPVTISRWQQLATPKDKDPLRILSLKDISFENSYLKIPYSQSVQALKLLAASGKLFFEKKQLCCDFFTPVELYYLVKDNLVKGILKFADQEFELTSCDFVCNGSNSWFVKGHFLKLIHTEITWKDLKQLYVDASKFSLKNLQDFPNEPTQVRVVSVDNSLEEQKQKNQPFPLLILKDRSGAFADLWMDYGEGKIYDFHENGTSVDRDSAAEKSWEKDLLETGFLKKQVGQTHYYCPLDQVAKSLSFLLEIGWNIQDHKKKKVLLLNHTNFEVSMESNHIVVRGNLRYDTHEADLKAVVGAFNKRERFVQIGSEAIGLLPEKWNQNDLTMLFEEGEIVSDGLKFKKHQIGLLEPIFQKTAQTVTVDAALNKLKLEMSSLSEIPEIRPSVSFCGTLRPYQQQGINWLNFLYTFGFNGILSDDMGLGKTVQILAFLSQLNNSNPVLIVMPTSLIFNWKREIETFLPNKSIIIHHGSSRGRSTDTLCGDKIILTSYTTMRNDLLLFSEIEFAAVILDEAQAIKNSLTQVAQAAYQLRSSFRLLLTGTPIENHLGEIWSHFHFLMPDLLGDEKNFSSDLQAGQSDVRYIQKIKKKIRPFILRRKKVDVAKDLPECIEQTVWVDMTPEQRRIYESYLSGVKNNLFVKVNCDGLSKHRLEIFEAILRLRQICCHPLLISGNLNPDTSLDSGKMEALLQDLENAIEENDKVLVYSQFTSMLGVIAKEVQARNWNYVYLDGSTKNREKVVNQFQEDPSISLFLISLKAGGTGLNLTAADHVCIFDPWWNEAIEKQAINRAHRIGRKTTVFAKRYATVESIEEKMMKLKEKKKSMIDNLLDEDDSFSQLTLEDFNYLLS